MRYHRVLLGLVALVIMVAGLLVFAAPSERLDQPSTSQSHREVITRSVSDPQWVAEAGQEPARVEFVNPKNDVIKSLETKGKLDPAGKAELARMLASDSSVMMDKWEKKCSEQGTGPDGAKTLRDAITEMEQLYTAKQAEAAMDMLRRDQYMTFAAEEARINEAEVPPDSIPIRNYNGGIIGGRPVDVLIIVPRDHPTLRPIMEQIRLMRDAQRDLDIQAFNALPEGERRARIEEHEQAVKEIRDLLSDTRYQNDDKQRRFQELSKHLLPPRWSYTVSFLAYAK